MLLTFAFLGYAVSFSILLLGLYLLVRGPDWSEGAYVAVGIGCLVSFLYTLFTTLGLSFYFGDVSEAREIVEIFGTGKVSQIQRVTHTHEYKGVTYQTFESKYVLEGENGSEITVRVPIDTEKLEKGQSCRLQADWEQLKVIPAGINR